MNSVDFKSVKTHLKRAINSQDEMLLKQQLQGKVRNISRQFCSSIFHGADVSFNKFESSFNSRVNWIDLEKIENRLYGLLFICFRLLVFAVIYF